jgi:hypothetical protein
MCPDKKLDWFNLNEDWCAEDCLEVDRIVRARWTETYLQPGSAGDSNSANTQSQGDQPPVKEKVTKITFLQEFINAALN